MEVYKTKIKSLAGTDYSEVYSKAKSIYKVVSSKTKRRPYIRSSYFNKEKVFIDYFWNYMMTKNPHDRLRRLKQYPCALDLIKYSKVKPLMKGDPNKSSEMLYRFTGINGNKEIFHVQVKEDKKTGEKVMMSMFPDN